MVEVNILATLVVAVLGVTAPAVRLEMGQLDGAVPPTALEYAEDPEPVVAKTV